MRYKFFFTSLLIFFSTISNAQTVYERSLIQDHINADAIKSFGLEMSKKEVQDGAHAYSKATKMNIPHIVKYADGSIGRLKTFSKGGRPLYFTNLGRLSTQTIQGQQLHIDGNLDLNLEGSGFQIGFWEDEAPDMSGNSYPLSTHQEFVENGMSRVTNGFAEGIETYNQTTSGHSTAVAGQLVASGIPNGGRALGIAPQASGIGFGDSLIFNELAAMTTAPYNTLVSNHSFGFKCDGFYYGYSKAIDQFANLNPMHCFTTAVGNIWLNGFSASKNTLSVGHTYAVGKYTDLTNLTVVADFGATEDLRIKPDVVGQSINVYMPGISTDESYISSGGSSFSSPSVASGAILLQEHYANFNNTTNFMNSSTMKALLVNTAKDVNAVGPEFAFGYGLCDLPSAARAISNDGTTSSIYEGSLTTSSSSYTLNISGSNSKPISATLVWNDPYCNSCDTGDVQLVNDLDIRIDDGTSTSFPWKVNSSGSVVIGDNVRDNLEKIVIDNPTGYQNYTITISHKGTLKNSFGGTASSQEFSLVVTGINNCSAPSANDTLVKTAPLMSVTLAEHANHKLTALNEISGSTTEVEYAAGIEVLLEPGFDAVGNCDFDGLIRDCDNQNLVYYKQARYNPIQRDPIYYGEKNNTSAENELENFTNETISIYPNPSDGVFMLDPKLQGAGMYQVLDSRGAFVTEASYEAEGLHEVNLSFFPAGIYFIHVRNDQGLNTYKLIKQ